MAWHRSGVAEKHHQKHAENIGGGGISVKSNKQNVMASS